MGGTAGLLYVVLQVQVDERFKRDGAKWAKVITTAGVKVE